MSSSPASTPASQRTGNGVVSTIPDGELEALMKGDLQILRVFYGHGQLRLFPKETTDLYNRLIRHFISPFTARGTAFQASHGFLILECLPRRYPQQPSVFLRLEFFSDSNVHLSYGNWNPAAGEAVLTQVPVPRAKSLAELIVRLDVPLYNVATCNCKHFVQEIWKYIFEDPQLPEELDKLL